jgi:hypothetical protein
LNNLDGVSFDSSFLSDSKFLFPKTYPTAGGAPKRLADYLLKSIDLAGA